MTSARFALVSAFTAEGHGGNPAAVVWSEQPLNEAKLLWLAQVFAQPATAFVSTEGGLAIRWFNSSGELALCGHGSLAAAHLLRQVGAARDGESVTFNSRAGPISVRMEREWLHLSLPVPPPIPLAPDPALSAAIGVEPRAVMRGTMDVICELSSEAEVARLNPDLGLIKALEARGVIVTARATDPGADYVLRFFAPRLGINEDAVTGTAHAVVAQFYAPRLGKTALTGRQLSRNGGNVRVNTAGEQVEISGQAVVLAEGELKSDCSLIGVKGGPG